MIVRPGLRCLFLWSATLLGEIPKDIRDGLKHVLQDPPPDFRELFELPRNDLLAFVGASQDHTHSEGHNHDYHDRHKQTI